MSTIESQHLARLYERKHAAMEARKAVAATPSLHRRTVK